MLDVGQLIVPLLPDPQESRGRPLKYVLDSTVELATPHGLKPHVGYLSRGWCQIARRYAAPAQLGDPQAAAKLRWVLTLYSAIKT